MTTTQDDALRPRCVATTGDAFCKAISDVHAEEANEKYDRAESDFFREAQFSSDGTTIVTHSEDQCLRTFVLPVDLLANSGPHQLSTRRIIHSPSNVQSYALYPNFDLENPSTTVALSAARDLPISLVNVLHMNTVHATYPLIHPTTEAYISPNCIAWSRDGSRFITGSMNQISVFDSSYDGSGPILKHKTVSGKTEKKRFGGSTIHSCTGIFNALSISPDGLLAAGTMQRQVTLYANEGSGECMTSFSLSTLRGERHTTKGSGVTQLAWSPCGTYLFVAERQSHVILVYDMRNTFERVAWLSGRQARTSQKLGIDVVPAADGFEVWAGGTDGYVHMWKNLGSRSGEHAPDGSLRLHDGELSM